MDREVWCAAVHGAAKTRQYWAAELNWTDWTCLNTTCVHIGSSSAITRADSDLSAQFGVDNLQTESPFRVCLPEVCIPSLSRSI